MVTISAVVTVSSIFGYTAVKNVCLLANKFLIFCPNVLSSDAAADEGFIAQNPPKQLFTLSYADFTIVRTDEGAILRQAPAVNYRTVSRGGVSEAREELLV